MTLTTSRTYPKPPKALVEGLLDQDFLAARGAALGGTDPATVERSGSTATVRFPRKLPLDDVPGPLRKLAGSGEVTQVETWTRIGDDRCDATWTSESSMPGTVHGTYEVVPDGDGARYTVVATAEVNVPLVGGRIAKEVEGHVRKLVEAELDFAATWFADH